MRMTKRILSMALIAVLSSALIFPLSALAAEPVKMPEKTEVAVRFYLDNMNPAPLQPEPIYITIESDENGNFSFDYPALAVSRTEFERIYFSGMHIKGVAYQSDGSDSIKFLSVDRPFPIGPGLFFGDLDVDGMVATLEIHADERMNGNFALRNLTTFTFETGNLVMYYDKKKDQISLDFIFYYREHHTYFETEDKLHSSRFSLHPIDFTLPALAGANDSATSSKVNGKEEDKKGAVGDGLASSAGKNSPDSDHAGPLAAIAISILATLLAILFGSSGGFIPALPTGPGGPAPVGPGGLSKWLSFDGDGDIEVTDPVNRNKRIFVNQGDGTYTDPITGATYTPEELSDQLEHRDEHSDTIREDEERFKENIEKVAQDNKERSEESLQLEKEMLREKAEREHQEKVDRVAAKLGMFGASEEEVRQELADRMEKDEAFRDAMIKSAEILDTTVDILETTVTVADYTMAVGEVITGPAGKGVSAAYKGAKGLGVTVAEKGLSMGTVTEGLIKGGTEAATTVMDAGVGKVAVTIGGKVAGEVAEAVNEGTDLVEATAKGLLKGAGDGALGAISDVSMGASKNISTQVTTKITEKALEKNVADPLYKEAFKNKK